MSPVIVVVTDVFIHQSVQMAFVEYDDIIEQISPAVSNPAFCYAVLPRASEAAPLWLDAETLHRADDFLINIRSTVEDQIAWCRVVRECFSQLLRDPSTARMPGDVAVNDPTPVMGNHEETVQDTKGQCGHGKEVHRSDHFTVVVQEGRPALCRHRTPRDLPHPAQDRSLRDVEAEHLQLAMNMRSAPGWVFSHHAEDEFAQFPAHASPACTSTMPREPLPVQLESGPMPTDNRLRPHENQRTLPSIPEPPQHHPEQFVRDSKPRQWVPPFQNSELLP